MTKKLFLAASYSVILTLTSLSGSFAHETLEVEQTDNTFSRPTVSSSSPISRNSGIYTELKSFRKQIKEAQKRSSTYGLPTLEEIKEKLQNKDNEVLEKLEKCSSRDIYYSVIITEVKKKLPDLYTQKDKESEVKNNVKLPRLKDKEEKDRFKTAALIAYKAKLINFAIKEFNSSQARDQQHYYVSLFTHYANNYLLAKNLDKACFWKEQAANIGTLKDKYDLIKWYKQPSPIQQKWSFLKKELPQPINFERAFEIWNEIKTVALNGTATDKLQVAEWCKDQPELPQHLTLANEWAERAQKQAEDGTIEDNKTLIIDCIKDLQAIERDYAEENRGLVRSFSEEAYGKVNNYFTLCIAQAPNLQQKIELLSWGKQWIPNHLANLEKTIYEDIKYATTEESLAVLPLLLNQPDLFKELAAWVIRRSEKLADEGGPLLKRTLIEFYRKKSLKAHYWEGRLLEQLKTYPQTSAQSKSLAYLFMSYAEQAHNQEEASYYADLARMVMVELAQQGAIADKLELAHKSLEGSIINDLSNTQDYLLLGQQKGLKRDYKLFYKITIQALNQLNTWDLEATFNKNRLEQLKLEEIKKELEKKGFSLTNLEALPSIKHNRKISILGVYSLIKGHQLYQEVAKNSLNNAMTEREWQDIFDWYRVSVACGITEAKYQLGSFLQSASYPQSTLVIQALQILKQVNDLKSKNFYCEQPDKLTQQLQQLTQLFNELYLQPLDHKLKKPYEALDKVKTHLDTLQESLYQANFDSPNFPTYQGKEHLENLEKSLKNYFLPLERSPLNEIYIALGRNLIGQAALEGHYESLYRMGREIERQKEAFANFVLHKEMEIKVYKRQLQPKIAQKLIEKKARTLLSQTVNYLEIAASYYKVAAEYGHPEAAYRLGALYGNQSLGISSREAWDEAVKWYQIALKAGKESARKALENMGAI